MCKTIKQKVRFRLPPNEVYRWLANGAKHTVLTGRKASISTQIGGKFAVFGRDISGINVDLVPGKRIVQAWRNRHFPAGVYSMAAIVLTPTPTGGTELVLTHRGVPKELIPAVENHWRQHYWEKLRQQQGDQSAPRPKRTS